MVPSKLILDCSPPIETTELMVQVRRRFARLRHRTRFPDFFQIADCSSFGNLFWGYGCHGNPSVSIRSWITELAYIQQMQDNDRIGLDVARGTKPPGFTAVGIFLFFGATMASLAATTLLWRGTPLDRLWALNPRAYKQLAPLGGTVGILFLLLGVALTTAGIGWFRRRLWGWRLAVVIIATQVLGDIVNVVRGDLLRGGIGVIIAGALLLFLLHPRVRATFA